MSQVFDVVLVDDNPDILDITELRLEQYKSINIVDTFQDPTIVAPSISEFDNVDCVVSDYDMPKMDGVELLVHFRKKFPDLPFILFTGKGDEEVASDAIEHGVSGYLQKGTSSEKYSLLANKIKQSATNYNVEKELASLERRLNSIVQQYPWPVCVYKKNEDGDAIILEVNNSFLQFMNVTREELPVQCPEALQIRRCPVESDNNTVVETNKEQYVTQKIKTPSDDYMDGYVVLLPIAELRQLLEVNNLSPA